MYLKALLVIFLIGMGLLVKYNFKASPTRNGLTVKYMYVCQNKLIEKKNTHNEYGTTWWRLCLKGSLNVCEQDTQETRVIASQNTFAQLNSL